MAFWYTPAVWMVLLAQSFALRQILFFVSVTLGERKRAILGERRSWFWEFTKPTFNAYRPANTGSGLASCNASFVAFNVLFGILKVAETRVKASVGHRRSPRVLPDRPPLSHVPAMSYGPVGVPQGHAAGNSGAAAGLQHPQQLGQNCPRARIGTCSTIGITPHTSHLWPVPRLRIQFRGLGSSPSPGCGCSIRLVSFMPSPLHRP